MSERRIFLLSGSASAGKDSKRCSRTPRLRANVPSAATTCSASYRRTIRIHAARRLRRAKRGAVWRIYLKVEGKKTDIAADRLWGLPYCQTKKDGGGQVLTCHGTSGIHGALRDAVFAKWPEENGPVTHRPGSLQMPRNRLRLAAESTGPVVHTGGHSSRPGFPGILVFQRNSRVGSLEEESPTLSATQFQ